MQLQFKTERAFKTGYTYLHGHNFVFDTYKDEMTLKFFYPEEISDAKDALVNQSLQDGVDYLQVPYFE